MKVKSDARIVCHVLQVVRSVATLHAWWCVESLIRLHGGWGRLLTRYLAGAECGASGSSWYPPCYTLFTLLLTLVWLSRAWFRANVSSIWLQSNRSVDVLWTRSILTTDLWTLSLFCISRFVHILTASGHLIKWATTVTPGHRTILWISIDRSGCCRLRLGKLERVWVNGLLIDGDFLILFKSIHYFTKVLGH